MVYIRSLTDSLLYVISALVEFFLGIRFILELFGANASNGFVNWVYEMSSVLLEPFRGIFPTKVFESTYVFDFSTIFAMLIYAILALLVAALLNALIPYTTPTKH